MLVIMSINVENIIRLKWISFEIKPIILDISYNLYIIIDTQNIHYAQFITLTMTIYYILKFSFKDGDFYENSEKFSWHPKI